MVLSFFARVAVWLCGYKKNSTLKNQSRAVNTPFLHREKTTGTIISPSCDPIFLLVYSLPCGLLIICCYLNSRLKFDKIRVTNKKRGSTCSIQFSLQNFHVIYCEWRSTSIFKLPR